MAPTPPFNNLNVTYTQQLSCTICILCYDNYHKRVVCIHSIWGQRGLSWWTTMNKGRLSMLPLFTTAASYKPFKSRHDALPVWVLVWACSDFSRGKTLLHILHLMALSRCAPFTINVLIWSALGRPRFERSRSEETSLASSRLSFPKFHELQCLSSLNDVSDVRSELKLKLTSVFKSEPS